MTVWRIALMASAGACSAAAGAAAQDPGQAPPSSTDSAASASKQSQPAQAETAQQGEIIVTAQRRQQRLQDVPMSVTAVTGQEIRARNVTDLADMQYAVPGLSIVKYGPSNDYVQIRGISTAVGRPTVGVYLDELPITSDQGLTSADVRLLDLQRVEVLRGPQATLYGEGSMGGTIRYITAPPDLDQVSGSADAEINDTKGGGMGWRASAILNAPLVTDRVGLRVVGAYEKDGGWIDRASTGEKNINSIKLATIRGTLRIKPSDNLDISLLGLYQRTRQPNLNFGRDDVTNTTVPWTNNGDLDIFQANARYDFGSMNFVASAGYLNNKNLTQYDLSPFYVPFLIAPPPFGLGLPVGFITEVGFPRRRHVKTFTSQARLASRSDGIFSWIVGAEYRNSDFVASSTTFTEPNDLGFVLLGADQTNKSRSLALYGEATLRPMQGLSILAGLRQYSDRERLDATSVSFGFPSIDTGAHTFHSLNPRFNVSYEFTRNSMVYVNVAKGFRSGGFNLTSAGGGVVEIPPTYQPDKVWTYEAGTKHTLLDGRLYFEGAVYRTIWTDIQSFIFAPGSAITITANSGTVKGWGVDLSATARPVEGLTLTGAYGWNNLHYTSVAASAFNPDKAVGDPVDFAVRKSWAASLDYRRPVFRDTDGFFRADYQHAGPSQVTLRNFGNQIIKRPARDLVNIRAGLDFHRFEVSAFAQNLFDERAPNLIGPFGTITEDIEQQPRVIGLGARVSF